tara:strand:+ start:1570 stop:2007 length:438 start_codon:yes stop_codon:yes gene_type:complete
MRRFLLIALTSGIIWPLTGCFGNNQTSTNTLPVSETLVTASQSWNGDTLSYPDGEAEMTLLRISVPVGFRTPVHTHPQPGLAYVVKGSLECVVSAGQTKVFSSGKGFATTYGDTPHYCQSIGDEPALVFVAYAGSKGQPVTVAYD